MRERRVSTRLGTVAVFDDDTNLPPVVLLHGLGGDHEQALGLLPAEAETMFRRIAIDMRAHGSTADVGPPGTLTYRAFAEDVRDVIAALQAERPAPPPAMVGVSMGAAVTLEYAAAQPGDVRALVLVRPARAGELSSGTARVFEILGRILRLHGPGGLGTFTEMPEYREVASASPAMAASLRKQFARPDAQRRAAVLESIPAAEVSSLSSYQVITAPALVLAAPHDPVHRLEFGRALARALPSARFRALPPKQAEPGEHEIASRGHVLSFLREVASR